MVAAPKSRHMPQSPRVQAKSGHSVAAKSIELMPGDVAFATAGDEMKTLLGSCVSIILTDPRRTVGSMCHIVHVGTPNQENRHNTAFGLVAMEAMFAKLLAVGIPAQRCEAYVYGGGNMFPDIVNERSVGDRNAQWALDFLADHGIAVVESALGGTGYRKVSWRVGRSSPTVVNASNEVGDIQ
ncbi:chemotaxis protein CheD [Curvibacter sp. APW13]|uniref:chemotaxis protein CheD n=1 Tax=Curvibacter sp. APW13 TaxID=3077236 RepID=UPI0028E08189|nr:chemotaxis protein CheD [Curvibacter sp. APW13]MDT8990097.1 chemotaxis protein CheD [Curvibacter sp. APW13]